MYNPVSNIIYEFQINPDPNISILCKMYPNKK
jgi:hypothetical protein